MIWNDLKKPIFILAPMDDVTDTVFRRMVASCYGPDLYFTEFASVDGFQSEGREAVEQKLKFADEEKPLVAQIWGLVPENYEKTVREIKNRGYAGIDINMGCPQNKIIKNGACAALINNRELAGEIIAATKRGSGGSLPVSVKTRIGFNGVDLSWTELLLRQGIDALTIHGRTVKQMSKVPNDWNVIGEIAKQRDNIAPQTKIIGNGDVLSRKQGEELSEKYGLDGVMIARGVFQDPYVFDPNSPWGQLSREEKLAHYAKHIKLFINEWGSAKNPAGLKKFAKVYVSGFPGAGELRTKLMECETAEQLLEQVT